MKTIAFVIGLLIVAVGAVGIVAPSLLLVVARHPVTAGELYLIAVVRIGVGSLLLAVAAASRWPKTLRVLGALTLVAGIVTPFLGVPRVQAMTDWIALQGPGFLRLAAVVALAIGALVAYTCAPAPRPPEP